MTIGDPPCGDGGAIDNTGRLSNSRLTQPAEEIYIGGAGFSRPEELAARTVRKLHVLRDIEVLFLDPLADFVGREAIGASNELAHCLMIPPNSQGQREGDGRKASV